MKDLIRKNIYQKINYILDSLPQIETYDNIVKDKFERIKSTRQRRNEIIAKKQIDVKIIEKLEDKKQKMILMVNG